MKILLKFIFVLLILFTLMRSNHELMNLKLNVKNYNFKRQKVSICESMCNLMTLMDIWLPSNNCNCLFYKSSRFKISKFKKALNKNGLTVEKFLIKANELLRKNEMIAKKDPPKSILKKSKYGDDAKIEESDEVSKKDKSVKVQFDEDFKLMDTSPEKIEFENNFESKTKEKELLRLFHLIESREFKTSNDIKGSLIKALKNKELVNEEDRKAYWETIQDGYQDISNDSKYPQLFEDKFFQRIKNNDYKSLLFYVIYNLRIYPDQVVSEMLNYYENKMSVSVMYASMIYVGVTNLTKQVYSTLFLSISFIFVTFDCIQILLMLSCLENLAGESPTYTVIKLTNMSLNLEKIEMNYQISNYIFFVGILILVNEILLNKKRSDKIIMLTLVLNIIILIMIATAIGYSLKLKVFPQEYFFNHRVYKKGLNCDRCLSTKYNVKKDKYYQSKIENKY